MKTISSYIITLILSFFTLQQACSQNDEAIFIYRNDGGFNAFFDNDIDSIVYSRIGLDSVEYANFVVQEVWTGDSVYRIPIAAIDSIGFQKPEVVLQKNVVKMAEKGLISYLEKAEGMTLTFSSSTPENLRPKYGDILTDFTSPLLGEGFVGKVEKCQSLSSGYIVICDSVYDEKEIFERCIGIQPLFSNTDANRVKRANENIDIPSKNVDIKLEKEIELNSNSKITASGGFNGTVRGYVVYNTDIKSYHVFLYHDWTPYLKAEISTSKEFDKEFNKTKIIRIPFGPPGLPLFVYVMDASIFAKGDLTASMSAEIEGMTYKYLTSFNVVDRIIDNHNTIRLDEEEDPTPSISMNASISGNLFFGAKIKNYIGFLNCFGVKAGGFADIYLGPKVEGEFAIEDLSAFNQTDIYDNIKDSKISITPLAVEAEAYAGIYVFDEEIAKSESLKAEAQFPPKEFYLLPVFSEPDITTDNAKKSSDISYKPNRNLIVPLTLGIGLYDKDNNLVESEYDAMTYQNEKEYTSLSKTFTDLSLNKEYTSRPLIRLDLGDNSYDIPATPEETFLLECSATTGESDDIKEESAICYGHVELPDEYNVLSYGIVYSSSTTLPDINNGTLKQASSTYDGDFSVTLSGLKDGTTYYYRAYIAVDGKYYYGEIMSFTTDKKIEEIVDLGLSVKWRGWNLGADAPEGYGRYYAWGETTDKQTYTWETYFDNPYGTDNEWVGCTLTSDISNTEYDAASVELGNSWRMPTKDEMQELVSNCTWEWSAVNGVNGFKVTGPNGNYIFLPAAGNADGSNITSQGAYGGYWTSTPNNDGSGGLAGNMYFYGSSGTNLYNIQWSNRYNGRSIRPVIPY